MRKELAGQKFNRWTVKDYAVCEKNNWKWLCVCECGTVRMVNEQNLLSGKSQSCGCLSRELARSRYTDLTGRQFGQLKVLERAGYQYGRVAWLCECECQKTCIVTAHELLTGKQKSCGCSQKSGGNRTLDLKNRRIGKKLTVLYPTRKRDTKGSVIWHCRCDCGNEIELSADALVHGGYQSCGCLRNDSKEYIARMNKYRHFYNGTCLECLNRRMRSDNKTGCIGVYETKQHRYKVTIGFCGERYSLGSYESLDVAVFIRKRAEREIHKDFIICYSAWLAYCKEKGEEVDFYFEVEKVPGGYIVHKGEMPWVDVKCNVLKE